MKVLLALSLGFILLFTGGEQAAAQSGLKLVPLKYSRIKLAFGARSAVIDLEDALIATNGILAGNPPHRYKVLFTVEKGGFLYLVADVRSSSPVSNPMAPCGGDSPQAILWVKADKTLKNREVQSEIYASCSYNYYGSKVKRTKGGLVIDFGGSEKKRLSYDNSQPEKGLIVNKI